MRKCHRCGEPWREKGSPGTREDCLKCGAALHVCANCRFYDAPSLEWCREPMARAEKPRVADLYNICTWFVFSDLDEERFDAVKSKSARMALEALFNSSGKRSGGAGQ
ncbi:MAG: hypothetical protein LBU23_00350 [Planctomycetota bacterium]|jgi:hypothetical protein|nr:hypothetical protein [Planctomycetota bacterium]